MNVWIKLYLIRLINFITNNFTLWLSIIAFQYSISVSFRLGSRPEEAVLIWIVSISLQVHDSNLVSFAKFSFCIIYDRSELAIAADPDFQLILKNRLQFWSDQPSEGLCVFNWLEVFGFLKDDNLPFVSRAKVFQAGTVHLEITGLVSDATANVLNHQLLKFAEIWIVLKQLCILFK